MFEHVSVDMLQRAMQPNIFYGRHILADTFHQERVMHNAKTYTILTQPEAWIVAQKQFKDVSLENVIFLNSMEHDDLVKMERALPPSEIIMGIGGGQAMDAAKYVAFRRGIPLVLAPTIVSVDASVTNTIAVRQGQRVRYIGFVVADAIPVDFEVVGSAPKPLNRAGIGDLLSIHTALWDWQHSEDNYDASIASEVSAIVQGLDKQAEAIADCSDEALRYIMNSYVIENTLCLKVGNSRPEEGSEHFLGYNIEYITGRGFVHGQLICLCTYVMSRLQDNRSEWVYSLIERARCQWRLPDLDITHETFVKSLLTLRDYAKVEAFPASVISLRPITESFAEQLAHECERR